MHNNNSFIVSLQDKSKTGRIAAGFATFFQS
jgi:hypothetical protein